MKPIEITTSGSFATGPLGRRTITPAQPVPPTDTSLTHTVTVGGSHLTQATRSVLDEVKDVGIRKAADAIVASVEKAIRLYVDNGGDEGTLPALRASRLESGSVIMEWGTPDSDVRLGFNLEPDPEESGWYLVTSHARGGLAMDGLLSSTDVRSLVFQMLSLLIGAT